jgi:hypothetical protein
MMVDMESGAEALKEAIKDALAATMEAMSKELAVMAIKALWEGITYANPTLVAAGAAYGSASALAAAGAGAIRALGEGGVVTRPTHALIGERGPEAVIPLNRASMGGGDINLMVVVNGSLIHEDDLNARIMQGVRMVTRGH